MLRCVSRYRNAGLRLYCEPGEVLRELDADTEALLLRDSPGAWEVVTEAALAAEVLAAEETKGVDAPPEHRMVTRERSRRKESERGHEEAMSSRNMPGVARPKGGA